MGNDGWGTTGGGRRVGDDGWGTTGGGRRVGDDGWGTTGGGLSLIFEFIDTIFANLLVLKGQPFSQTEHIFLAGYFIIV